MLEQATKKAEKAFKRSIKELSQKSVMKEVSVIKSISAGTAILTGLSSVQMNELVVFKNNVMALVHSLSQDEVGVVFLNSPNALRAGDRAKRTHRVLDVPVGEELLGRVITPLGEPLDGKGEILTHQHFPMERASAPIMQRAPVQVPLQTGIKAIDTFTPIGRGQRELILGDRQTGKTALALDTILNQADTGVISIYCAIGQRTSNTAHVIEILKKYDCLKNTVVVVADGEDESGLQYVAPYAATSIGEYFMEKGHDVLIIYDDLTAHARAYRQMSLLLKNPPGREAYPGDIFYIHARLLERSTHLKKEAGGGSLTALPIVATEAGNISAYIPTNIISITDGQIYLSTSLFRKGIFPAIDTGRSVSRVGGDAQLPAFRSLVGPLKLFYAQFEELEKFEKFGTQLDEHVEKQLKRGKAIRKVMQQKEYSPIPVENQIAVLNAANAGLFDGFSEDEIEEAQNIVIRVFKEEFPILIKKILQKKEKISPEEQENMIQVFKKSLKVIKHDT